MANGTARIREFTGWHMLAVIGLFFGTIIAVNLVLAWFAIESWTGLVVKNSYVASQNFDDKIADVKRQNRLGWKSTFKVEDGKIYFTIHDASGGPLSGLDVNARIGHPTDNAEDYSARLVEKGAGIYSALAPASPGQWIFDIESKNAKGQTFREIYRIVIPAKAG